MFLQNSMEKINDGVLSAFVFDLSSVCEKYGVDGRLALSHHPLLFTSLLAHSISPKWYSTIYKCVFVHIHETWAVFFLSSEEHGKVRFKYQPTLLLSTIHSSQDWHDTAGKIFISILSLSPSVCYRVKTFLPKERRGNQNERLCVSSLHCIVLVPMQSSPCGNVVD